MRGLAPRQGSWEEIHTTLCESERVLGKVAEKPPARPSSWIVSVGEEHSKRGLRGSDGAKKINGRERHLLVAYKRAADEDQRVHPADTSPIERAQGGWCWIESVNLSRNFATRGWTPGAEKRTPEEVDHRGLKALSLEIVQRRPR